MTFGNSRKSMIVLVVNGLVVTVQNDDTCIFSLF